MHLNSEDSGAERRGGIEMADKMLDLRLAKLQQKRLLDEAGSRRDHKPEADSPRLGWVVENLVLKLGSATAAALILALVIHE